MSHLVESSSDPNELIEDLAICFSELCERLGDIAEHFIRYRVFCERYPSFPVMLTSMSREDLSKVSLLVCEHTMDEIYEQYNDADSVFTKLTARCCEKIGGEFQYALRHFLAKVFYGQRTFLIVNPSKGEMFPMSLLLKGQSQGILHVPNVVIAGDDDPVFADETVQKMMALIRKIFKDEDNFTESFVAIRDDCRIVGLNHPYEAGTKVYHRKGMGCVKIESGGAVRVLFEASLTRITRSFAA